MPHKINRNKSDDPAKWTITDYKEGDNIRLLENSGSYFQIIDDLNAKDYVEDVDIKDGYNYYVIAASNNFGSETVKDGYKAQSKVKEIIENKDIKDIIVIIDRNAVTLHPRSIIRSARLMNGITLRNIMLYHL